MSITYSVVLFICFKYPPVGLDHAKDYVSVGYLPVIILISCGDVKCGDVNISEAFNSYGHSILISPLTSLNWGLSS